MQTNNSRLYKIYRSLSYIACSIMIIWILYFSLVLIFAGSNGEGYLSFIIMIILAPLSLIYLITTDRKKLQKIEKTFSLKSKWLRYFTFLSVSNVVVGLAYISLGVGISTLLFREITTIYSMLVIRIVIVSISLFFMTVGVLQVYYTIKSLTNIRRRISNINNNI